MKEVEEFQNGQLWKLEEGTSLMIGVTDETLSLVGAITGVEISDDGDEFDAGEWIAEVRGKEQTIDVVAPCKLRIMERNLELVEQPGLIEDDPTGDAWLIRAEKIGD